MNRNSRQHRNRPPVSPKVRSLVAVADDAAYVSIVNRVAEELPDEPPIALDELESRRTMPYYDPHGEFIAELDGHAVGIGRGQLNPLDKERVGWVSASVLPEYRRRHIGTALAETAMQGLRARGAKKLRAGALEANLAAVAFLRSLGFQECRSESWMRRTLEHLPSGVGENIGVGIRETTLNDDDLQLTVELINEAFKEDWDFSPVTVEARRKRATELARQGGVVQTWVAMLGGQPVGIIQARISPRDIAALKVQRGELLGLGVLKPFRQQGIAKALTIRGLQFLKAHGMTEVDLSVDNFNPVQALDIYLKLGFRVIRRFLIYETPEDEPRDTREAPRFPGNGKARHDKTVETTLMPHERESIEPAIVETDGGRGRGCRRETTRKREFVVWS
jgi:mycothiol synthase